MRVLITGGTGFIGSALVAALRQRGDEVLVLSRTPRDDVAGCRYLVDLASIDPAESIDAVVNLAGASLAGKRWSEDYKREIVDSRLRTTRAVLSLIERLDTPPRALLSASAIGYYGHHHDNQLLDESGPVTPGFAATLCRDWEALASEATTHGTRVCLLRLGVVLDSGGGALAQMSQSFRLGVASWLGSGLQWLSWVHRQDAVAALLFLLDRDDLSGPFNITAPVPVTGWDLCQALKTHFRTLVTVPLPAPLARLMLGEVADELLLNGQRVVPAALQSAGFSFNYRTIDAALAAIYG